MAGNPELMIGFNKIDDMSKDELKVYIDELKAKGDYSRTSNEFSFHAWAKLRYDSFAD